MNSGSGQSITTVNGKVLRIDVKDGADDFPEDANRNYRIPPGNPLVGREGRDARDLAYRHPQPVALDLRPLERRPVGWPRCSGGLPGEINHLSGVAHPT